MDEKLIRKHYGEKMWHFCRDNFATILEEPMRMHNLLIERFYPTHSLYDDLYENEMFDEFKSFLMSIYNKEKVDEEIDINKTPEELLKKAGYTLHKCKSEEDIQSFKKYYAKREELCTFRGGRLDTCHVFFAVKDNADKLDRNSFKNPKRQDEYGTSVISIQFTKDKSHILSIKNRYNHTVANPDSTFSNDLDNIITGLTKSFEKYYGFRSINEEKFEIPGYVLANDGKHYRSISESNNIYYCQDNIIIDNFKVMEYYCDKSRYLLADYFIIDLQNKKIILYDEYIDDDFINVEKDIRKIDVTLEDGTRVVKFYHDNGISILKINNNNEIISYENDIVKTIGELFLSESKKIKTIKLKNVTQIGDFFLSNDSELKEIEIPNVLIIGNDFLSEAMEIKNLSLPKILDIGDNFLTFCVELEKLSLPNLLSVGDDFLLMNKELEEIDLPNIKIIKNSFIMNNQKIKKISFPKVEEIGRNFLLGNKAAEKVSLPCVSKIGSNFMCDNKSISKIELPNIKEIGYNFLRGNKKIEELDFPNLEFVDDYFLYNNTVLEKLNAPKLSSFGEDFMREWINIHSKDDINLAINNDDVKVLLKRSYKFKQSI